MCDGKLCRMQAAMALTTSQTEHILEAWNAYAEHIIRLTKRCQFLALNLQQNNKILTQVSV